MQYFLIDFVSTISFCIVCAICFYGVGLSYIVLTILTMMTAFPHIAIIYHIYCINWIINIIECALWVPEFFGYDVSFVDVVKFDYRNFYIKFLVYYTRLYFFSVLHNTFYILCLLCDSILFDPGRCYCYWDSIKPCKSNEFRFVAYGSVTRG